MIYTRTNNSIRNKRIKYEIYLGAFIMLVFVFMQYFFPYFISSIFTSVATPFWRTEFAVKSGSLSSTQALLAENESLKRQLQELEEKTSISSAVLDENIDLKKLLGRTSTTTRILAAVLEKPPISLFDEYIIDIGSDHNLQIGDKVYASGNVLIGQVSLVLSHTAKVKLYSTSGEKYQVSIGRQHVPATALGIGGGQFEADVPRSANINEGDFVNIPSVENNVFGIVSAVVSNSTEAFSKVIFKPLVNIFELRWVMVEDKK